ncbi:MAG: VOC family protein [Acidobacteriota bacterium]
MGFHSVCHVEWSCTDLERTKAFLWGLFGWEFEPFGEDYLLFTAPEGPDVGIQRVAEVGPGDSPTVYVEVPSVATCSQQAEELGGEVVTPKAEIPGVGWFSRVKDPDGNVIGLFEPHR